MIKKSGIYYREIKGSSNFKEIVYVGEINANDSFRHYSIIANNKRIIQLPDPNGEDDIAFMGSSFEEQLIPARRMKKQVFRLIFEEKWFRGNI